MKILNLEGLTHYTTKLLDKVKTIIADYIPLCGSTSITGTLRSTCEYQTTSANGLRIAHNNKGTMLRNDGYNTYFLMTNDGDPYGNWNDLRPLIIDNTTGLVRFENGLQGNLNGNATSATTANSANSSTSSTYTNALSSTGFGDTNFTYYQTSGDFDGNSNWCHYLIANHGSGENYYHYTIGLPFWDTPIYKRQWDGGNSGWHKFHTSETITYGTWGLTPGSSSLTTGNIYLQYE